MSYHFFTTSSHFQHKDCYYTNSPQGTITVVDCNTNEKTILKVTPLTYRDLQHLAHLFEERVWKNKWSKLLTDCAGLHSWGFPWSCYIIRNEYPSQEQTPVLGLAFLQSDPASSGDLLFKAKVFSYEKKIQALFMLAAWKWIKKELLPKTIKEKINIPILDNEGNLTSVALAESATIRTTFLLGEYLMEIAMQNESFLSFDIKYPRNYSIEVVRALDLETIQEESSEEEKTSSPPKQKKPHCCAIL